MSAADHLDGTSASARHGATLIVRSVGIAALTIYIAANIFFWFIRELAVPSFKEAEWGQYGDFIGGITNPFFALLTFGALLYTILLQQETIRMQREELSLQREEMKATNKALNESKDISDKQYNHIQSEAKKADLRHTLSSIGREVDEIIDFRGATTTFKSYFNNAINEYATRIARGERTYYRESYVGMLDRMKDLLKSMNELLTVYFDASEDGWLTSRYADKYKEYAEELVAINAASRDDFSWFLPEEQP